MGRLLKGPGTRLVTLTGTGGIGKTRLALELASVLGDLFPDGVVYVPLAPLDDPTLVVPTIAQVLGLREAGDRPLDEILHDSLRNRKMLLVLDNFERVLGASGEIADLLAATSELVILVTSRAPLRIRGEQEYPLDPLTLPDPSRPAASEGGAESAAVQLFVARAQAARASSKLTEGNRAAVEEICRRLDGLPLAIELAAARTRLLSPEVLLARLGHALSLLSAGARDLPERQRTMRSTLAWSYDLLTPSEQTLFRQLGVFAGGWTLDAVEAVASVAAGEDADVLGLLEGLIEQSLVTDVSGAEARYRFLEPSGSTHGNSWTNPARGRHSATGTRRSSSNLPRRRSQSCGGRIRRPGSNAWKRNTITSAWRSSGSWDSRSAKPFSGSRVR